MKKMPNIQIFKCMVCFCHKGNSFNKDYIKILENISNIKYDSDKESSDED